LAHPRPRQLDRLEGGVRRRIRPEARRLQPSRQEGRSRGLLPAGQDPRARGVVTVPPDIAVEIVSPSPADQRRDRVDKRLEYAAFGVRYYWLVSPEARLIEILELGADGRYIHALGMSEGKVAVIGCEDLTIDLDDLWREVVRAEREETAP